MAVITISRMYGSGGSEVAERVANTLGWPLFDNGMIDAVAERLGISHDEVEAREERVPTLVERIASALSLGSPEAIPAMPAEGLEPTDDQIVDITARIIQEAVQTGPAVFVGRGAQCLLAERQDALHVFCYAPPAALRRYAMEAHHVASAEADRIVADMNHRREAYVKRHWNRRWLALENYQLCLDTSWLGLEGAAELVVEAAKRHFPELA